MTVHAAKGLEFPMVWVAGLEDGMFPYRGLDSIDTEDMEEERRLAYVATTRARRRLVLSFATRRRIFGQTRPGIPSRFLRELPQDDVEDVGWTTSGRDVQRTSWDPRSAPGDGPTRPSRPAMTSESYVDYSDGADLDTGLRVGMTVRHATFGVGRVREIGGSVPPVVTVSFPGHGTKRIAASYLELQG